MAANPDSETDLFNERFDLVKQDLDFLHRSETRERDWRGKIRQWEVLLISAVVFLLLREQIQPLLGIGVLAAVIVPFMFMEAWSRSEMVWVGQTLLDHNDELQVDDDELLRSNIQNWKFANYLYSLRTFEERAEAVADSLKAPSILLWHGGIFLAGTTTAVAVHLTNSA